MQRGLSIAAVLTLVCLAGPAPAQDDETHSYQKRRIRTGHPRSIAPGFDLIPLGYPAADHSRVSAVDVDGDGKDEIAIAGTKDITVIKYGGYRDTFILWQDDSRGGATAIGSGDIDDDGLTDLIVGWGSTSDAPDAKAQLVAYRSGGTKSDSLLVEVLATPKTSRNQFTSLLVSPIEAGGPTGIVYSHYASKYDVRGAFLSRDDGAWKDRQLFEARMATELAVGPLRLGEKNLALLVGRPYGDESKEPGDVYILDGKKRTLLPTLRGVRSLAVVTLGSRRYPRHRICYGDGWHWKYREVARGLVTCTAVDAEGGFEAEVIQKTQSYEINALAAADLDGDGVEELIARGSKGLYRYIPLVAIDGHQTWDPRIIGPGGRGFAVVDTNGDGRDEIALGGDNPSLIQMR